MGLVELRERHVEQALELIDRREAVAYARDRRGQYVRLRVARLLFAVQVGARDDDLRELLKECVESRGASPLSDVMLVLLARAPAATPTLEFFILVRSCAVL
jgi:hypothetical protein